MSKSSALESVAAATLSFVQRLSSPARVEVKVASGEGMPLLCAVEAALAGVLPSSAAQELVWLSGAPAAGAHQLRLQAFGAGNELLAEAVHDYAA